MEKEYEVIIIGGGPAGLTAGLYTSRGRLKTLVIEKELIGGLTGIVEWIENYPGFTEDVSGYELGELMHKQATKYGLETVIADVIGIELKDKQKLVKTSEGDFSTDVVIIASGSERQKMGVPGEEEFRGKGVSYCATCDGVFFTDKPIAVVGGGDSAISEALHLTKYASKVTVIHRRDQLRASKIVQEKAFAEPKIDFRWNAVVESIEGKDLVEKAKLRDVKSGKISDLDIAGIFVSIGFNPNTGFLKGVVPLDKMEQVITNERMETEVPGILAAGDVRSRSARQVITAAGDGATAAVYAEKYLSEYE